MVEQFGLAIILSSLVSVCALISGTINFLSVSIRQTDELSITVVPTCANLGAHSKEVSPPAENMAMVGLAFTASSMAIILRALFLNKSCLPTDFFEATSSSSVTGKFRSSRSFSITVPTIPVAPITAIFIGLFFLKVHYCLKILKSLNKKTAD